MHRLLAFIVSLLTLANPSVLADGIDIPPIDECASIVLRTSAGWWIRIDRDDKGTYGFGTDLAQVSVRQGVFDFRQIYQNTRRALAESRENAEEAYVAAAYYAIGASSAREYYLLEREQSVANLFRTARSNEEPPTNAFETQAMERVESLWQRSPYRGLP